VSYPAPLAALIDAFERFPGIGRRSAERMAFFALRDPQAKELPAIVRAALERTLRCRVCGNVGASDPCALCADQKRDARSVLVVEEPRDVEAVERAGVHKGRYFVLMGALNPATGGDERTLNLRGLIERASKGEYDEVILGTDPDAEGEATATLVLRALEKSGAQARVTRLARGLPAGSALEYLHRGILEDAMNGRVELRTRGADGPKAQR
jgi:recombination protein RecR